VRNQRRLVSQGQHDRAEASKNKGGPIDADGIADSLYIGNDEAESRPDEETW
jgi:hypothetical protein